MSEDHGLTAGAPHILALVAECQLFAGLTSGELAAVEQIAHPLTCAVGADIFRLGEQATDLLLVGSGTVELTLPLTIEGKTEAVTLEQKTPPAVIAWSALVPPHRFTMSARAATSVSLVALSREDLHSLFERHERIQSVVMSRLCEVIGNRVSVLEALLIRKLQRWVDARLA